MGNEENRIDLEEMLKGFSMDELSPEELGEVTGGKVTLAGYGLVFYAVMKFKEKGFSKEYCIQEMTAGWNKGSIFKSHLTDATDDDLQDVINYINMIW
jgi:hypothetical protein